MQSGSEAVASLQRTDCFDEAGQCSPVPPKRFLKGRAKVSMLGSSKSSSMCVSPGSPCRPALPRSCKSSRLLCCNDVQMTLRPCATAFEPSPVDVPALTCSSMHDQASQECLRRFKGPPSSPEPHFAKGQLMHLPNCSSSRGLPARGHALRHKCLRLEACQTNTDALKEYRKIQA